MEEIIEIPISSVQPETDSVLINQSIPPGGEISSVIKDLLHTARDIFSEHSHPRGILKELSVEDFEVIYRGEGLNEPDTPVDKIFRKAERLALFAVTIGGDISKEIARLFEEKEFALGSMVDSVASAGTDKAADYIEEVFIDSLIEREFVQQNTGVMRYSPGYCGWHMSGQKRLFSFLHPEKIGITLLDSYLMEPLKSVSGVIISGNKEIHDIDDTYPFCSDCTSHSCQLRKKTLFAQDILSKRKVGQNGRS
jgi:hypothetical protein